METRAGDGARALLRILGDLPGELRAEEPLAPYTTFRIGGKALVFYRPAAESALAEAVVRARAHGFPWLVLGGGSKLLIPDRGFPGLILATSELRGWREDGEVVRLGAGVPLSKVARRGAWQLAGIPGTVGGAVAMNAGTKHGAIADQVAWVQALLPSGRVHTFAPDESGFTYRDSLFRRLRLPVLGVGLRPAARQELSPFLAERARNQPLDLPSAGCVFRNPPDGRSAGWLIDQAGLKGVRVGDAMISDRHANFICNLGRARACEVLELVDQVQDRVSHRFGVWLRLELEVVGE
ncbi:TPA: UDP-N-acetylenolpyruvoylglucosamine reductase [Candidatus Acetothermia bacterium]|nr:UDP-N-acetylenolpyruvoylglucosamine reductase [Candidatus Acetothermia bacterium]HAZ30644.1 UDP-N-acetylenolpyruvoylglucosamine reductase [Candidatus Acetothermia bacterium]